jgi:hypothetical protein
MIQDLSKRAAMRRLTGVLSATAALVAALTATSALAAPLDRELDTDGFDPAVESYRINEARRRNEINRQLELKYRMLWAHGFDPASPPVEQPLGHEYQQTGPNRWEYRPVYPESAFPESVSPEEVQPSIENEPETLPAPNGTLRVIPQSSRPLLIAPQTTSSSTPAAIIPSPTVAPELPAPRDAIPADRLIPQTKPRKAKASGPREF